VCHLGHAYHEFSIPDIGHKGITALGITVLYVIVGIIVTGVLMHYVYHYPLCLYDIRIG